MKTYVELKKINVNEHTEKKGNLTYLSWAWAVDQLLMNDPTATWIFQPPIEYNDTMMVSCKVYAFGKTMEMQLPVMDNRNNAITRPDARKISDAQMRCLAKCIACFGIGLYIYAGEDLPEEDEPVKNSKDTFPNGTPISKPNSPVFIVEKKPIAGQKGEWQIVAPAKPEGNKKEWLDLIKTSSHMLLDLCTNEEDVMTIFKKNKVLFDTVKAEDAVFFKEMMAKFTDVKNQFNKE